MPSEKAEEDWSTQWNRAQRCWLIVSAYSCMYSMWKSWSHLKRLLLNKLLITCDLFLLRNRFIVPEAAEFRVPWNELSLTWHVHWIYLNMKDIFLQATNRYYSLIKLKNWMHASLWNVQRLRQPEPFILQVSVLVKLEIFGTMMHILWSDITHVFLLTEEFVSWSNKLYIYIFPSHELG